MGSPVSSSLRTTNNGTISFNFEGFDIVVVVSYIPPSSGGSNPIASCKVDNKVVGTNTPPSAQNNWPICDSGNLSDGQHTLVVDISNPAGSSIFFDYILYAPSPNSPPDLTDASVRIEADDPSITYSGGFVIESDTGSAQLTNAGNAFIKVSFTGQQLTWYGVYSTFLPFVASTAEYSIDGGSPIQFPLAGLVDDGTNTTALLNQNLFQTEVLPQGSHELTATYLGNGEHTALGLAFVVVQNGSGVAAPSITTSASIGDTPGNTGPPTTSPQSSSDSTKSHNNRNIIIGVVVGVGAFLFLSIGLLLFRRHVKRTRVKKEILKSETLSKSDPMGPLKTNSSEFLNRNSNPLPFTTISKHASMPVRLTSQTVTSDSFYNTPTRIIPPMIPNEVQSTSSTRTSTLAQSIDVPETSSLLSNLRSPYTPTPTPFHIPTLPTHQVLVEADQQPRQTAVLSTLQIPHIAGFPSHNLTDPVVAATASSVALDGNGRRLPESNFPARGKVNPGPGAAREMSVGADTSRETTEVSALNSTLVSPSPLAPLTINDERNTDSGVRLGRQQTLSYGALSLSSVLSKDGLPPVYTSR